MLSSVKTISGNEVEWKKALVHLETTPPEHTIWDGLLKSYVDDYGWVDYDGIQKDVRLIQYLDLLSSQPPSAQWSEEEAMAYWINAYNAFTVKLIADHWPVKSIKDISEGLPMINSPWDIKFFKIGGIDFDLNTIEHDILRSEFEESRIHFALNCASISCPILLNEAYHADSLDVQLERQTQKFLSDQKKNQIGEKKILLSLIFKWYADDFGSRDDILAFIRQSTGQMISSDAIIDYTDYYWSLNIKK